MLLCFSVIVFQLFFLFHMLGKFLFHSLNRFLMSIAGFCLCSCYSNLIVFFSVTVSSLMLFLYFLYVFYIIIAYKYYLVHKKKNHILLFNEKSSKLSTLYRQQCYQFWFTTSVCNDETTNIKMFQRVSYLLCTLLLICDSQR